MTTVEAFAPAKINLTLHVTGRRSDGYHLLDSLVAFADVGDAIRVSTADDLLLSIDGPFADSLAKDTDNLVLRAARMFLTDQGARILLTKNLPVASGIGGGSSDAAATLRALSELWQLPMPSMQDAMALGADVPVCLAPGAQRLAGVGDRVAPVAALPPCQIVLVNPGVAVSTPSVFRSLHGRASTPMPAEIPSFEDASALATWLVTQRNDLTDPAISVAPVIAEVLSKLTQSGSLFSAMSGSGATCFALFNEGDRRAQSFVHSITRQHPDWWVARGKLLANRVP